MRNQDYYRIVPIELAMTVMSYTIGVGILTMPRALAQELDTTDGWITIIISGTIFMVLYTLYTRLQRYFPEQTLLQYIGQGPIGKWGSKCLAVLFIVYFLTIISILTRILSYVVNMYLMDQTPPEVIVAVMLLLSTYAVHKGMQGMIHLNLMFMPIVLIIVTMTLILNIPEFDIDTFRPVLAEGISPVIISLKLTLFAFLGVEIIYFLMGYMKKSDLRSLPLNLAVGVVTLFYLLVTMFTYAIFSLDSAKYMTFPMLELAKEIEVPGIFFERVESFMMTVWIMTIFNTISISHYLIYNILRIEFFTGKNGSFKKTRSILPSIIQFLVFIIAFLPKSLAETFTFGDWSGYLGGFNVIAGLGFGYLTVWIRNHKSKREKDTMKG